MVNAYSDINATVKLKKKGTDEADITANIVSYSESGIKRDVKFERVFGGAYIPTMIFSGGMSLSLTYISTDNVFTNIMDGTTDGEINSLEIFNLYKVKLQFNDGTNSLGKVYYNCYPIEHSYSTEDSVVKGTIKFVISPNNISANSNYYEYSGDIGTVDGRVDDNDTLMEWT